MSFTPEQNDALKATLDPKHVATRQQGGQTLSYVEGWHVIAEANRIFGFDGWTRETIRLDETNRALVELKGQNGPYQQWRVGYLAVVRVVVHGVERQGTGFGSGMAKPEALGDAIESAIKEAETDAMKRAFSTFGNVFGLALYDKTKANVAAPAPTMSDRAARVEGALKRAESLPELSHAWERASSLCAALSTEAPDRLTALTQLYESRRAALTATDQSTPFDEAA